MDTCDCCVEAEKPQYERLSEVCIPSRDFAAVLVLAIEAFDI